VGADGGGDVDGHLAEIEGAALRVDGIVVVEALEVALGEKSPELDIVLGAEADGSEGGLSREQGANGRGTQERE
jgi:hypothetical protein